MMRSGGASSWAFDGVLKEIGGANAAVVGTAGKAEDSTCGSTSGALRSVLEANESARRALDSRPKGRPSPLARILFATATPVLTTLGGAVFGVVLSTKDHSRDGEFKPITSMVAASLGATLGAACGFAVGVAIGVGGIALS